MNSLRVVDDFRFRHVIDPGIAGSARGAGGRYVVLPPGYDGEVPEEYVACRSRTYTNWLVVRVLARQHRPPAAYTAHHGWSHALLLW